MPDEPFHAAAEAPVPTGTTAYARGLEWAARGAFAAAAEAFGAAIAAAPQRTEAFHALSQIVRFNAATPLLRQMVELHASAGLGRGARIRLCFGLAKAFDDLGAPARAMRFLREGNGLVERGYDATAARRDLAALRDLAQVDALRRRPPLAVDEGGPRPLFIIGMPRAGTTLVEAILARHPAVFAGGEMTNLFEVEQALLGWARAMGFAGSRHALAGVVPAACLARNRAAVLARVRRAAGRPVACFTDKLPDNSQRLGLVAALFPEARLIYVRRHPLDCCLSNYFQYFAVGQGFSFRQDWLGARYREVAATVALSRNALDLPVLDLCYETLVSAPEPTIRRLLTFAGLDWDAACLTPAPMGAPIVTASQWQARQPITARSVGRWRAYADWLGPLVAALGGQGWIEAEHAAARQAGGEAGPLPGKIAGRRDWRLTRAPTRRKART